jgi:hypothetical protein
VKLERAEAAGLPYLAAGAGAPLVYLAGLHPEVGVDSRMMRQVCRGSVSPFTGQRRVLFFNRRPGLVPAMTMGDLASEQVEGDPEGGGRPGRRARHP